MVEDNNGNNRMALGDLFGAGKVLPIDKLVDMFTNSVGRLFKSHFTKKDADAKAYELREMAKAQSDAMKILASGYKEASQITAGIGYKDDRVTIEAPKELPAVPQPTSIEISEPPLEQRAIARVNYKEAKKQLNVESVTSIAFEQLKDEGPVADEPVNEDWATRFFNIVEDVSDEEMQVLWGRILAGEIKQPKSYSLRALELLRNLSKEEAEIFTQIANLAIYSKGSYFIFKVNNEEFQNKFYLSFTNIMKMVEAGIINSEQSIAYNIKSSPNPVRSFFIIGESVITMNRPANAPEQNIPIYKFTQSGSELLKLIVSNPPFEYLKEIANYLKTNGTTVYHGQLLEYLGNSVRHGDLSEF